MVFIGFVDCSSKEISCEDSGLESSIVFLPAGNVSLNEAVEVNSLNYEEIAKQVLVQLPDAELIDEEMLKVIDLLKEPIAT